MARAATRAEVYVVGLNELLRDLRLLPKDAQKELRQASAVIADRYMVPAWKDAAMKAGPWGEKLAASVRAKKDRVPAVKIGQDKKTYSGGASPNMLRYPTSSGQARESWAPFEQTNWIHAATGAYKQPALNEWSGAIDQLISRF